MATFGRFLIGSSSDATRGNETQCIKSPGARLPLCAVYLAYLAAGVPDTLRFKNTGHNTRKAVHVKKMRNNVKYRGARARPTISSQVMGARPALTRVCSIQTIQRTWLKEPESWEETVSNLTTFSRVGFVIG